MSTLKVNAFQNTSGQGFYPNRARLVMVGRSTISISADENVSSISDLGTGRYSQAFSNNAPNINYSNAGWACDDYTNNPGMSKWGADAMPATSGFAFSSEQSTALYDVDFIHTISVW